MIYKNSHNLIVFLYIQEINGNISIFYKSFSRKGKEKILKLRKIFSINLKNVSANKKNLLISCSK